MTKEIALHCMKSASELKSELCEECPIYGQTGSDHCFEDALQYVIGMLEQEPFKPMVEIDLYAVIKQKYIEREVIEKIRAEIAKETDRDDHADDYCDGYFDGMRKALTIIDKYKAESEDKENE